MAPKPKPETAAPGMKVISVELHNFKKFSDLTIEPKGRHVYLVGPNASGKSSVIQAIFTAVTKKDVPPEAITTGKDAGSIKVGIGTDGEIQYYASLKFTAKNKVGTLVFETADGAQFSSPVDKLREIMGDVMFDINEVLDLTGLKQVKAFQSIIESITGQSFTEIEMQIAGAESKRKEANAEVKRLTGVAETKHAGLQTAGISIESHPHPKDFDAAQAAYNEALEEKRTRDDKTAQVTAKEARISEGDKVIADLEAKLAGAKELKAKLTAEVEATKKELEVEMKYSVETATHNLKTLNEYNDKARQVAEAVKAKEEREAAIITAKALDEKVQELRAKKEAIITSAKLPVEGLSFTDEGITLNGLPLSPLQINQAKIIEVGIKLQAAINPRLKIIRVPNASLLDAKSLKAVEDFMDAQGYQGFIELVKDTTDEKLQITYSEA